MDEISAAELSGLIASIYDCALDPDRWVQCLQRVCEALQCVHGRVYMADMRTAQISFGRAWNTPSPEAERVLLRFQGSIVEAMRAALDDDTPRDPDLPFVLSRNPGGVNFLHSPFTEEYAAPLGWCDGMNAIVLREGSRVGVVSTVRHRDVGFATDREIGLLRLLTPHLRRAAAIGDLLEMRRLEADRLGEAMDRLSIGIGVVAADASILRANEAAQTMIRQAEGPIRVDRDGRLAGVSAGSTDELHAAIAAAAGPEQRLGGRGAGVVLRGGATAEPPAVAHVLPLKPRGVRRRSEPRAAAAVFISSPNRATDTDGGLGTVARALGLTPAETRLLSRLVAGESMSQAREALGIAETTAKTHLLRIFSKAGVSRQPELIALVTRLLPPIRTP